MSRSWPTEPCCRAHQVDALSGTLTALLAEAHAQLPRTATAVPHGLARAAGLGRDPRSRRLALGEERPAEGIWIAADPSPAEASGFAGAEDDDAEEDPEDEPEDEDDEEDDDDLGPVQRAAPDEDEDEDDELEDELDPIAEEEEQEPELRVRLR